MQAAAPVSSGAIYPSAARAWFTVAMLAGLYFFSYADRLVLGLLAMPIQRDLGLSDAQFGLLIGTTFAIFYTIFGLAFAPLVDRYNRKRLVVAGAFIWTATTTLSAFAQGFAELLVLRLGVSLGEAILSPAAISMIADMFPREKRVTPTSVYNGFSMLGSTGVFLYAAILYEMASSHPLALPVAGVLTPWRSSLFLIGMPGLLLVFLFLFTVREPARQADPAAGHKAAPLSFGRDLVANWRLYLGFLGGVSILAFPNMSLFSWYATVLVRGHGTSIAEAGTAFGIVGLVFMPLGAISTPLLLWLFARWWGRDGFVAMTIAVMTLLCVFMILTLTAPTLALSLLFLAPTMFLMGPCSSIGFIGIQQFVAPHLRGRIVAVYLTMYSLFGLGMGPFIVGLISAHVLTAPTGLGHAIAISSILATGIGILLTLLARRPINAALA